MRVSFEGFDEFSALYPPHSYFHKRSRDQILSVRRKYYAVDITRVSFEGFDEFSALYPPHSYFHKRSRGQILSVRRKYYAKDTIRVSFEGFDEFSALYPPHSYCLVQRSRGQILSSGENTTLLTLPECPLRVLMSYPLKSIFFFSSSPKYSLSAAPPKLYRPLPNKTYFLFPPTSPVLIISSISSIFSFSSSQSLLMSSFVLFSIS